MGFTQTAKKCPELNVGIHLIFGCPDESSQEMVDTAKQVNSLPIHNVKLHNLHVLKNTPLAEDYQKGLYLPLAINQYAERAMHFLQHLSPNTPVHRLCANASRSDELIAPYWTGDKMRAYQYIVDYLKNRGAYHGQFFTR